MKRRKAPVVTLVSLAFAVATNAQIFDEEKEESRGKLIGTFNSYHHQVNGEVYAVDEFTLLIKNFVYDGNGKDTFFWAGGSNRPGTQGFIVPNENGRTNVLKRQVASK